jgi:predicted Zn-dependent peptidase
MGARRKAKKQKVISKQTKPGFALEKRSSDQTHMVFAFRGPSARDKSAAAATVLMGILGSGMSSRLFQKLRGQMGACYYVHSQADFYTDHGFGGISTGIDKNRVVEVTKAILEECRKLTREEVTPEELQKVKDFLSSHMQMGLETSDGVAVFAIENEVLRGELKTPAAVEDEIRRVSAKDVLKAARTLFSNDRLNLAIVGNIDDGASVKKVLRF